MLVVNAKEMDRMIRRLGAEIAESIGGFERVGVIGIRTGGVFLAEKLIKVISKLEREIKIDCGILDITLYRDDISRIGPNPVVKETRIDFSVDNLPIILVDDVFYTGRTVRCAMDAIMDLGRPKWIKLAVLVDRDERELPIRPDFCGTKLSVRKGEKVVVKFEGKERGIYVESAIQKEASS